MLDRGSRPNLRWGRAGGATEVLEREPTARVEILADEFLKPLGITQRRLADHIGCDVKVINRIVNGRSAIGAELAMRLAGARAPRTPEFRLNAQQADVHAARRRLKERPKPLVARSRRGPKVRKPSSSFDQQRALLCGQRGLRCRHRRPPRRATWRRWSPGTAGPSRSPPRGVARLPPPRSRRSSSMKLPSCRARLDHPRRRATEYGRWGAAVRPPRPCLRRGCERPYRTGTAR